jgi:hypothetical protein
MKSLLILSSLIVATSAFAKTEKIDCTANSNSDYLMQIVVDASTKKVLGASLYNQDWSQTPEATYQEAKAVGTINPMAGVRVILKDDQTIDIDYSVFSEGHEGLVVLNSEDFYYCH